MTPARLHGTDMSILRWMAGVKLVDRILIMDLLKRFNLQPIKNIMQQRRLRWYGHIERMSEENWVNRCRSLVVNRKRERGRPRKTCEQVIANDLRTLNLLNLLHKIVLPTNSLPMLAWINL